MSSKTRRSSIKEEYEDVEEIGVGSFATVYRARHRPTGRIVAIKAVHLKRLSNAKLWANLQAECEALRQVGSQQHIVELYDIVRGDKYVYLVMEYCDRGDLQSYARDYGKRTKQPRGRLPEPNVRRLMAQLKEAVRALHSCNLVHRDLKPQNLLLKSASPMSSSSSLLDQNLVLKVADFGFVRRMDTSQEQAETMCGSPLYMAPEVLCYEKYDQKADLWSIGAIMYELLYGQPPYRAENHIVLARLIERAPPLQLPPEPAVSNVCADLLLRLLQKNPEKRISFRDFFRHPFLNPHNHSDDAATMDGGAGALAHSDPKPIVAQGGTLSGPSLLTISLSRRASHPVLARTPSVPSSPLRSLSASTSHQMLLPGQGLGSLSSSLASSRSLLSRNRIMRIAWEEELIDLETTDRRRLLQRALTLSDLAMEANDLLLLTQAAKALVAALNVDKPLNSNHRFIDLGQALGQVIMKRLQAIHLSIQAINCSTYIASPQLDHQTEYLGALALEAGFKDLLGYPNVWRVYQRIVNFLSDEHRNHEAEEPLESLLRERLSHCA